MSHCIYCPALYECNWWLSQGVNMSFSCFVSPPSGSFSTECGRTTPTSTRRSSPSAASWCSPAWPSARRTWRSSPAASTSSSTALPPSASTSRSSEHRIRTFNASTPTLSSALYHLFFMHKQLCLHHLITNCVTADISPNQIIYQNCSLQRDADVERVKTWSHPQLTDDSLANNRRPLFLVLRHVGVLIFLQARDRMLQSEVSWFPFEVWVLLTNHVSATFLHLFSGDYSPICHICQQIPPKSDRLPLILM